jgi:hypothetical protein
MRLCLAILAWSSLLAQAPSKQVSQEMQLLKDLITADSLRGAVSFLASDLLEGRETPSRGADIAAEYIAAQFRAAGLEAAGDDGYFQTARLRSVRPPVEGVTITISDGDATIAVDPAEVSYASEIYEAFAVSGAPAVKAPVGDDQVLTREQIEGKVVLTHYRTLREVPAAERAGWYSELLAFREKLRPLRPALVININPKALSRARGAAVFVSPESASTALRSVTVTNEALSERYESLTPGATLLLVSATAKEPETGELTGRNVAGILPGADAALKHTYVLVSAHYDHIGTRLTGEDRVYNGANDNASGVAGMVELARAFARLEPRPSRSIIFVAYFGEEKGLIGSRYYAEHPLFPLNRTVANLNLEHLGRTDDNQGSQTGKASVTGFQYSSVGAIVQSAGQVTGYEIHDREGNEAYFERSDNAPLAEAGVPAHTLVVTFEFPDYHDVGDEWRKLDYGNMEAVVETAAVGVLMIAVAAAPPQWNEAHPKTARYRAAQGRAQGR